MGEHVAALLDLRPAQHCLVIDPEIADIELPFYAYDTNIHAALLQLAACPAQRAAGPLFTSTRRANCSGDWHRVTTEQVITRAGTCAD